MLNNRDLKKAELYIELLKEKRESFNLRRNIEWKINFGLWSGLIIVTGYLKSFNVVVSFGTLILIYIPLFIVYSLLWSRGCWVANEKDKRRADLYRNKAERLLGYKDKFEVFYKEPRRWEFFKDWSRFTQVIATALFEIISIIVLSSKIKFFNN